MPQQDYDYVDFMRYSGDTDKMEKICRVYLTKGKLYYEGTHADEVKKMVDDTDVLKPYIKIGGYPLLAMLPVTFSGGYFFATQVKEPYDTKASE